MLYKSDFIIFIIKLLIKFREPETKTKHTVGEVIHITD